jgi:hypothetical protein
MLQRWKSLVVARELYALLTTNAFCLPNNPGDAAVYVCPTVAVRAVLIKL